MGQPATGSLVAKQISQVVIFCANVLGVATLLNLGRSFGILIAFRELKSYGLYGRVRHPMYATDILLRIGFLINHFNLFTVLVFIISTGCYVYRAILEERFLIQQPEYREYMNRVRYRFIPFVL
jgi:protein-S-isoprenylcysteine O-methyltransferase Ste14